MNVSNSKSFVAWLALACAAALVLGCSQASKESAMREKSVRSNDLLLITGGALPLESREAYDPSGLRTEFVQLAKSASRMAK